MYHPSSSSLASLRPSPTCSHSSQRTGASARRKQWRTRSMLSSALAWRPRARIDDDQPQFQHKTARLSRGKRGSASVTRGHAERPLWFEHELRGSPRGAIAVSAGGMPAMRLVLRFFGLLFAAGTILFVVAVAGAAGFLWHYPKALPGD